MARPNHSGRRGHLYCCMSSPTRANTTSAVTLLQWAAKDRTTSTAPAVARAMRFLWSVVGFFEGKWLPSAALALTGLFLVVLGLALLVFVKKHLERLPFSFSSVEVADRESLGLLIVFSVVSQLLLLL